MITSTALYPDAQFPSPPALLFSDLPEVLDVSDPGRSGDLVPSKGLEWSFIILGIGIVGLLFLLFKVMGTSSDVTPTYDRESQIAPREMRRRAAPEQPDIGTPSNENR